MDDDCEKNDGIIINTLHNLTNDKNKCDKYYKDIIEILNTNQNIYKYPKVGLGKFTESYFNIFEGHYNANDFLALKSLVKSWNLNTLEDKINSCFYEYYNYCENRLSMLSFEFLKISLESNDQYNINIDELKLYHNDTKNQCIDNLRLLCETIQNKNIFGDLKAKLSDNINNIIIQSIHTFDEIKALKQMLDTNLVKSI